MPSLSPKARYNRRVLALSAIYGVSLIGASYGIRHHLIAGPAVWAAALVPALAIVGIFAAIGAYLAEETDEYLRMLMTRRALWASGFALGVATIWGFLESFGLVGHVDAYFIAVLWFAGLGIGALANRFSGDAA